MTTFDDDTPPNRPPLPESREEASQVEIAYLRAERDKLIQENVQLRLELNKLRLHVRGKR